jgi:hypothetical protein
MVTVYSAVESSSRQRWTRRNLERQHPVALVLEIFPELTNPDREVLGATFDFSLCRTYCVVARPSKDSSRASVSSGAGHTKATIVASSPLR